MDLDSHCTKSLVEVLIAEASHGREPMWIKLLFYEWLIFKLGFSGGSVVKNLPANAGDARDVCSIPGSGRSPRGGNGNPFQ